MKKKLVIMISMMFSLTACEDSAKLEGSEVFAFSGTIYQLEMTSSGLIVLSDEGMHHFEEGELSQTSPSSWRSNALIQVGPERYLANLPYHSSFADEDYGQMRVIESLDGGLSWHLVTHNYSMLDVTSGVTESPLFFAYDEVNNQLYAGISGSIFSTMDYGRHWELLRGHGQDTISSGGTGGEDSMLLNAPKQQLWLLGADTSGIAQVSRWSLANDALEVMQPVDGQSGYYTAGWSNSQDSNHMIAVTNSQVVVTYDNGSNWELTLDAGGKLEYGGFTHLQELPSAPGSLFIAADDPSDEGYPLVLYCSENSGADWHRVSFKQGTPTGGITAMTADSDYLYLAVNFQGVFKVALGELTAQGC